MQRMKNRDNERLREMDSARRRVCRPRSCVPVLRFTPAAWAKLLRLGRCGPETGAFGISAAADPLRILDVRPARQTRPTWSTGFEDDCIVEGECRPERYPRVWVRWHAGDCPRPRRTDEETFSRLFAGAAWAVLLILARGGRTYARLRFNVGPGGQLRIPVDIEAHRPVPQRGALAWEEQRFADAPEPSRVGGVDMPPLQLDESLRELLRNRSDRERFGREERLVA